MTEEEKKQSKRYKLTATYISKENKNLRTIQINTYKNIEKEIKKIRKENKEIISIEIEKN